MQFGQKLAILEHFEVLKPKLIFVAFLWFFGQKQQNATKSEQYCPNITVTL